MKIRVKAEAMQGGLALSEIATQDDAESLCNFFREKGFPCTIAPPTSPPGCRILTGMTMQQFVRLVELANIELAP